MNIDQIKKIKLQDFLATIDCKPVKQYGVNLMYLSPLRTEKHASFKVNTELNLWYDFGIGRGGNIIDLAELLYNSSDVSYLIHQIERNAPGCVSVSLPTAKPNTPQNSFENLQVLSIAHPALIKYLGERGIDIEIARTVCKELHFDTRGKHYFGIGFPNIAGGYEIRNPFFKGGITPKDISLFHNEESKQSCFVFEGFIDFLSFMMLRRKENDGLKRQDYLVLNSVSNIHKALEPLSHYENVQCFLDTDEAGRNAYLQLSKELGKPVTDASTLYNGYKDLNEYLCAESKHSERAEIKKSKGLRL
ncbi:toprim domain-containing protein [Prevotella intermedia]|uniref:toprim domain-containing protein n=1 Tax=Prevotella intermedia TaxID=28131 RepID=UPI000BE71DBC|nr:toprim domain-containing protein [Prevotella intermedia]PDP67336.1 DNA primase [Prevotella intermedia]